MSDRLTPEQIDVFLDRHKDPADARRFLQEAGLLDENGELAKPYRPEPEGPTKAELRQLFDDQSGYSGDDQAMDWSDFQAATRAALARWGRRAPG